MTKPMSRPHGTSQLLREFSNEELDAVPGGVTSIVSSPKQCLTIILENTRVSG